MIRFVKFDFSSTPAGRYCLLTGAMPFEEDNDAALFAKIAKGEQSQPALPIRTPF